jgi:hypothetical protein
MYPEYILKMLRQRRGLDANDKSRDDVLNSMSMDQAFDEVCNWNGLINYGGTIRGWIMGVYGHYPPY